MDPFSTARYGMMTAQSHLAAAAGRVASGDLDALPAAVVEQVQARQQVSASAAVIRVADETWRALMGVAAR
jgi:hypothetical protein